MDRMDYVSMLCTELCYAELIERMIQDGVVPSAGLLLLDWYTCSGVCMKSREVAGYPTIHKMV